MKKIYLYLVCSFPVGILCFEGPQPDRPSVLTQDQLSKLNYQLVEAVEANDIARVRQALDRGADPNAFGGQLILRAAELNNQEIIMQMLKAGGDINATEASGATPLFNAIRYGRLDTANFLLDHGANPDAQLITRETPLIQAIRSHRDRATRGGDVVPYRDLVQRMIRSGADATVSGPQRTNYLRDPLVQETLRDIQNQWQRLISLRVRHRLEQFAHERQRLSAEGYNFFRIQNTYPLLFNTDEGIVHYPEQPQGAPGRLDMPAQRLLYEGDQPPRARRRLDLGPDTPRPGHDQ